MFRRIPPNQPSLNLWLSSGLGVPVGIFVVAVFMALFKSESIAQSLQLLLDTFVMSAFSYFSMLVLLILYGFPSMKVAVRYNVAWPVTAITAGALPGLIALIWYGVTATFAWLALSIGLTTATIFVRLAYRKSTSNKAKQV